MLTRRQLLAQTGLGAGALALTDLMSREGLAAEQNPLASKSQHFPAKAKNIIWLFMHGGPSQVDTFDPKPALAEYDGKSPPAELHELHLQFTDVSKQKLMASRHKFQQFGEAGIPMNEGFKRLSKCADDLAVVRGMHHEVFNHTPGIFLSNTGDMHFLRGSLSRRDSH